MLHCNVFSLLLKLSSLPEIITISPTANDGALDDPFRHPYFIRTTGGPQDQAKVMIDLMENNAWDLFSIIYSNNAHQRSLVDGVLSESDKLRRVCISKASPLPMNATLKDAKQVLTTITEQVGVINC